MKKAITFFKDWIWQGFVGLLAFAIMFCIAVWAVKIVWIAVSFVWNVW